MWGNFLYCAPASTWTQSSDRRDVRGLKWLKYNPRFKLDQTAHWTFLFPTPASLSAPCEWWVEILLCVLTQMICVAEEVKTIFSFFYELLKSKHLAAIVIAQSDLNGFHS